MRNRNGFIGFPRVVLTFNISTLQCVYKKMQCSALEYTQLNETQHLATQSEPVELIKLVFGCRLQTCKLTAHSLSSQLSSDSESLNVQQVRKSHRLPPWVHITAPHLGNQERPCVIFPKLHFPLALPITGTDLGQFKASILWSEVLFLSNQRPTSSHNQQGRC